MPHRAQLLAELAGETDYGVLLLAQMGGVPNEIQLAVQTAQYDAASEGLRPRTTYAIRALGVREHRLMVGVFGRLAFHAGAAGPNLHPLLLPHNTPRTAVHFFGAPRDVNELVLDIMQTYVFTFGPWRHLVEQPDDLNVNAPLATLLGRGAGLLGTLPAPLAERMARVLEHHGLTASLAPQADFHSEDEHGRSRLAQALTIDTGYVVALDFSVERMG